MNFDSTTLYIIVGALIVFALLMMFLVRRGHGTGGADQVTHDTPNAVAPAGEEGRSVADEGAAAARDVAGDILGVERELRIEPASGPADNLQTLKGVGPKLAKQLNEAGVTRFDQLAGLSANELAFLDAKMGAFRGRLERDRVVEQAAFLARGDRDGYQAIFGNLGSGA
jgi:predicted flap endonuclease-1-like 5' DNA nuclease